MACDPDCEQHWPFSLANAVQMAVCGLWATPGGENRVNSIAPTISNPDTGVE